MIKITLLIIAISAVIAGIVVAIIIQRGNGECEFGIKTVTRRQIDITLEQVAIDNNILLASFKVTFPENSRMELEDGIHFVGGILYGGMAHIDDALTNVEESSVVPTMETVASERISDRTYRVYTAHRFSNFRAENIEEFGIIFTIDRIFGASHMSAMIEGPWNFNITIPREEVLHITYYIPTPKSIPIKNVEIEIEKIASSTEIGFLSLASNEPLNFEGIDDLRGGVSLFVEVADDKGNILTFENSVGRYISTFFRESIHELVAIRPIQSDVNSLSVIVNIMAIETGNIIASEIIELMIESKNEPEYVSWLSVGDFIEYTPHIGTFTAPARLTGHSEEQVFETEQDMLWRVLTIEGENITLISSTPTRSKLTLQGVHGYNNGIEILNNLTRELYSSAVRYS